MCSFACLVAIALTRWRKHTDVSTREKHQGSFEKSCSVYPWSLLGSLVYRTVQGHGLFPRRLLNLQKHARLVFVPALCHSVYWMTRNIDMLCKSRRHYLTYCTHGALTWMLTSSIHHSAFIISVMSVYLIW